MRPTYTVYITLALKNIAYKFIPCMVELKQFFAFFGGGNFLISKRVTQSLSRDCILGQL